MNRERVKFNYTLAAFEWHRTVKARWEGDKDTPGKDVINYTKTLLGLVWDAKEISRVLYRDDNSHIGNR